MIIKRNKCIQFSSEKKDLINKYVYENRPPVAKYEGVNHIYGNRWNYGHQSLDRKFYRINKKYRKIGDSVSDV